MGVAELPVTVGSPVSGTASREPASGPRKAVLALVSLGDAHAAQLLRRLPEDVLERAVSEMAAVRGIPADEADRVLEELRERLSDGTPREGGPKYAKAVLVRALGEQAARELLERTAWQVAPGSFDFLADVPPEQVAGLLKLESAQTAAVVLANLNNDALAAKILDTLPSELQADVAKRVALLDAVSSQVVEEVADVLGAVVGTEARFSRESVGGVAALAKILTASDRTTERQVLEGIEQKNPALAEEVRSHLFVFEDLATLDDRSLQRVLRGVELNDIVLALRGTSDTLTSRVLANMSERAASVVQEELDYLPPQPRRVIEQAQTKIVAAVRQLDELEEIDIRGDTEALI